MSRHIAAAKQGNLQAIVGWDNPLQTFFASVTDPLADEDAPPVLEVGFDPRQPKITSVEQLVELTEDYLTIPPGVIAELNLEYASRTEPTPLQKRMAAIFGS